MIPTLSLYAGVAILWFLGLGFIVEAVEYYSYRSQYIGENINRLTGVFALIYIALTLVGYGVYTLYL